LLDHEIDVRSVLGKGSVFSIIVRSLAAPSARVTHRVASNGPDPTGKVQHHRCKIVVVDDDPDVLDLLEQLLKAEGHIVRTAVDAAAALALVAAGAIRPEILLTDYNLPNGMDGLELLSKLRDTLQIRVPAIILTGDISRNALTNITESDCVQLSKPVKRHELTGAIERLLPQNAPLAPPAVRSDIIHVVDDDGEIRASIKDVLETDGRIVEAYASAEQFLDSYRPGAQGCLLVDAHLPGISGVALIDTLRRRGDHLPAILITGGGDIGLAVAAMRTGACDFIEKPVGRAELLASITRAIEESRDVRIADAAQEAAAGHVASLTPRQRGVMDMVLAGHPSKNIAADLGISQRTVENHRAAIMHKMGARSLPELARMAQAAAAHGHRPLALF
jgi:two-component system CheB/CheR fusion protein